MLITTQTHTINHRLKSQVQNLILLFSGHLTRDMCILIGVWEFFIKLVTDLFNYKLDFIEAGFSCELLNIFVHYFRKMSDLGVQPLLA